MFTVTYLKYKVLSILEALHLYSFPIKGAERITKTLATLTDTIEQLHIGEEEAIDEANEIQDTIDALTEQKEELHTEADRAAKVKANLKTLMGE